MLWELSPSEIRYFRLALAAIVASAAVKKMKDYTQHGRVSTYRHSMAVSYYSYLAACKLPFLKIDRMSTLRGGMLHDLYLYDWHKPGHKGHGFSHAGTALVNAEENFDISEKERNIISSHMWPLNISKLPKCR